MNDRELSALPLSYQAMISLEFVFFIENDDQVTLATLVKEGKKANTWKLRSR